MAGELAAISILKNDSIIQGFCGTNPTRVFPFQRPQGKPLPAITVRSTGTEPNGTMDGPSGLDFERLQIVIWDDEFNTDTYALEQRVRELLDRPAVGGSVNGVNLESCSFEDRDTFKEQLVDKEVNAIEHMYKAIIKR